MSRFNVTIVGIVFLVECSGARGSTVSSIYAGRFVRVILFFTSAIVGLWCIPFRSVIRSLELFVGRGLATHQRTRVRGCQKRGSIYRRLAFQASFIQFLLIDHEFDMVSDWRGIAKAANTRPQQHVHRHSHILHPERHLHANISIRSRRSSTTAILGKLHCGTE